MIEKNIISLSEIMEVLRLHLWKLFFQQFQMMEMLL